MILSIPAVPGPPHVLAIGVDPRIAGCHVAKFLSVDTVKGYDLIILDARNCLREQGLDSVVPPLTRSVRLRKDYD